MGAPVSATLTRHPLAEPPTLEERMALTSLAMDDRLNTAGVEASIRAAGHDIPEILVDPLSATPDSYGTPVAAVLQQAHRLMLTRGWCRRWLTGADGAVCLLGAIRAAGGGGGHQDRAEELLLELVRREFPDAATVSGWNDGQRTGRPALRMLDRAARHADRHGI